MNLEFFLKKKHLYNILNFKKKLWIHVYQSEYTPLIINHQDVSYTSLNKPQTISTQLNLLYDYNYLGGIPNS